ncbi:hypothetical protein [Chitinibacter sp. GC72]|uniref:hypothetical protein n=1 Tax=Chitinibacter sp. GC72 TaxID=1526917 RepID=UPI0012F84C15|nr:hypothetical protein [Chitinibacter sp. GC72]
MYDDYQAHNDMDETTLHAWQFYLAVAQLALSHLASWPAGSIAITDDQEHAYWVWQGATENHLAWAPVAEGMVCFDSAILVAELLGLSAEEIDYRRDSLSRLLQSDSPITLQWPKAQLQRAIRSPGEY